MTRFWIDLINPSDVHFFAALAARLPRGDEIVFTTRYKQGDEVSALAREYGLSFRQIGADDPSRFLKRTAAIWRILRLCTSMERFDCALSFENFMSVITAALRRSCSVVYLDNDLALWDAQLFTARWLKRIEATASCVIVPAVFDVQAFKRIAGRRARVFTYDGCKEQVYVAGFRPDPEFPRQIPFDSYVVVRPEALFAVYVKERRSIVPELIARLESAGYNVVMLPRIDEDVKLAEGTGAYVPPRTLSGLNLCWYASAVLTGSGTLGREAACLGVPAVTFFPEKRLLSVDAMLVRQGKLLHSRSVGDILHYLASEVGRPRTMTIEWAQSVREDVVRLTLGALSS